MRCKDNDNELKGIGQSGFLYKLFKTKLNKMSKILSVKKDTVSLDTQNSYRHQPLEELELELLDFLFLLARFLVFVGFAGEELSSEDDEDEPDDDEEEEEEELTGALLDFLDLTGLFSGDGLFSGGSDGLFMGGEYLGVLECFSCCNLDLLPSLSDWEFERDLAF